MITETAKKCYKKYGIEIVACKNCGDKYCKNVGEDLVPEVCSHRPQVALTSEKITAIISFLIHSGVEVGFSYSQLHNKYSVSKNIDDDYLSCIEESLEDSVLALLLYMYDDFTDTSKVLVHSILNGDIK